MRALATWLAAAAILAYAIAAVLSMSGEPARWWMIHRAAIAAACIVGAVLVTRVPILIRGGSR